MGFFLGDHHFTRLTVLQFAGFPYFRMTDPAGSKGPTTCTQRSRSPSNVWQCTRAFFLNVLIEWFSMGTSSRRDVADSVEDPFETAVTHRWLLRKMKGHHIMWPIQQIQGIRIRVHLCPLFARWVVPWCLWAHFVAVQVRRVYESPSLIVTVSMGECMGGEGGTLMFNLGWSWYPSGFDRKFLFASRQVNRDGASDDRYSFMYHCAVRARTANVSSLPTTEKAECRIALLTAPRFLVA